ncbi:MAG: DEAD/DEAH box helicase [Nitrospirae bacterium]|nr:DEAD/DEAH box helicase [Nitrospirota bacterium]
MAGNEPEQNRLEEQLRQLKEDNARLKALLTSHGIAWEKNPPLPAIQPPGPEPATPRFSSSEKVSLFRRLFRGRNDVYPLRWESAKGTSGYAPACGNEWTPGVCHKPKVRCGDCTQRVFLPVTDQVIYGHLTGKHTIGVYPLLGDDTCCFLSADFDEADWKADARAFIESCKELDIPAALEVSRSGNGAHVWIFFSDPVPAREARQLGALLISHTCDRTRQLSLSSYDRFFPNQDTLPKGGFGNLIALPLQKLPREKGGSVFVDGHFEPYPDQWAFLSSMKSLSKTGLENALLRSGDSRNPLDVASISEEEEGKPWQRQPTPSIRISGPFPESLTLVLSNQIFIAKTGLSQSLANRLIRLAAFPNPEFYKAQALRLPVWNKPRLIGCAENYPQHIGLPRGSLDAVLELLEQNGIGSKIQDERLSGMRISVKFTGTLRKDQKAALGELLKHDVGVLHAPTAFGKTVTSSAMIVRRKVSTLVIVHRTELLRQWQERLIRFLDISKCGLGTIGGGKTKPSGKIDIAVMQSLSRREDLAEFLDGYGQIIVDECHHLSAFSFESVLKQAKARYVVGLTATPVRRDGHHPIIFMQCGPIRHSADRSETTPERLEVWPRQLSCPDIPSGSAIQEVFRILANDPERNRRISRDVMAAYREGRKILVLTERTDHLELLREALGETIEYCFVLHGRLSRKTRATILGELDVLNESAPRVLLSTGRLIGEGFDHPPLDTLVLAMPISWKGTLQQYAGRLHRECTDKRDARIYDYVETGHPQLNRMWDKRQKGYRNMGYRILPLT